MPGALHKFCFDSEWERDGARMGQEVMEEPIVVNLLLIPLLCSSLSRQCHLLSTSTYFDHPLVSGLLPLLPFI